MGKLITNVDFRNKILKNVIRMVDPTEDEEFKLLFEGLVSEWTYNEQKNSINSFIAIQLNLEDGDYVNDLNLISSIEQDTNLTIGLAAPSFTDFNEDGWQASFRINEKVYPGVLMPTEGRARLFVILLYHRLLLAANRTVKK